MGNPMLAQAASAHLQDPEYRCLVVTRPDMGVCRLGPDADIAPPLSVAASPTVTL